MGQEYYPAVPPKLHNVLCRFNAVNADIRAVRRRRLGDGSDRFAEKPFSRGLSL